MGIRLYVTNKSKTLEYYGTKHYSYNGTLFGDDALEAGLKSAEYLYKLGKIDRETYFGDCNDTQIELTADEFRTFIGLYSDETGTQGNPGWRLIDHPQIKELMEDSENKILCWE